MAIVKSGFLTAMSKSVAGLNFYRADGTQYVRSKPTLPEGYVPTVNQALAQEIFGVVSARLDRVSGLFQMLELNYSLVNKNAKKTYRDIALGAAMYHICRRPDAKPTSYNDRVSWLDYFTQHPVVFLGASVPISFQNAIPWPVGVTEVYDGDTIEYEITTEGVDFWKLQILEAGYYPADNYSPFVIAGNLAYDEVYPFPPDQTVGPWAKFAFTKQTNKWTCSVPMTSIINNGHTITMGQAAIACPLDPAYYDGLSNLYVTTAPLFIWTSTY